MTALVMQHLPLVACAPDGIKKLRALILELAVRGRLVNQDPSEEAAVEFLKRITVAKTQFDAGRSKRSMKEAPSQSDPVDAFPAPAGWMWTTFGAATICRDGERVPVSQMDREHRAKVYDYYGASGVIDKIDGYLFDKPLLLIGEDGANLINRTTPIAFIARGRYWVNNHAHVIDGISEAYLEYLALYINAIDLRPYVTGTAQPKMNQAKLNSIPVPLPPEPEQHRIVAKVDELMALCDRLEADQADAEAAHAQLVQALLDSLTQATDAADFRASWQRLSEHFHTLFTTEASIDALKQPVLQLAVMGKLVPQIATTLEAGAFTGVVPFAAPDGWTWHTFGETWESSFYGPRFGKEDYVSSGGTPTIRTTDMTPDGLIELKSPPELMLSSEQMATYGLVHGDLLVTRSGSIGTMALFMLDIEAIPSAYLIRIRFSNRLIPRFGFTYLRSPFGQQLLGLNTTSVGVPNVNATKMALFPIACPPLEEQHRIVAKVDELMALCDQLKAQLAEARQQHAQLATALVEQAVA